MEPTAEELLPALDEVVSVLEDTCEEASAAAADAQHIRDQVAAGGLLRDAEAHPGKPGLVRRVAQLQHRLGAAAARLRRSQARRLHQEGASTEEIAGVFGVSRQRVSALLRRDRAPSG